MARQRNAPPERGVCFLSKRIAGTLTIPATLKAKKAVMDMMDFACLPMVPKLNGYLLTGDPDDIRAFKKKAKLCQVGVTMPVKGITPYEVLGYRKRDDLVTRNRDDLGSKNATVALEAIDLVLTSLARTTGYRFHVVFDSGPAYPPALREDGVITVVIGAAAPGAERFVHITKLCGVPVVEDGYLANQPLPCHDYGTVLEDHNEQSYAQIVDDTIYLLLPMHPLTLERYPLSGGGLFSTAMIGAWNAYEAGKKGKPKNRVRDEALYYAYMEVQHATIRANATRDLRLYDERIGDMNKKLIELYQRRISLLRAVEGFHIFDANKRKEYIDEWKAIAGNPLIRNIFATKAALLVETKPIITEHEGKKYRIGSYTIRYEYGKAPSVWATNTFHPDRVPHPHISKNGVVCFGNVAQAIKEAGAEGRTAEVFDLALRWLADGYDPVLADKKIEEWPLA